MRWRRFSNAWAQLIKRKMLIEPCAIIYDAVYNSKIKNPHPKGAALENPPIGGTGSAPEERAL
jgi:hypothetical protein